MEYPRALCRTYPQLELLYGNVVHVRGSSVFFHCLPSDLLSLALICIYMYEIDHVQWMANNNLTISALSSIQHDTHRHMVPCTAHSDRVGSTQLWSMKMAFLYADSYSFLLTYHNSVWHLSPVQPVSHSQ